ncbi:U1 small nuclear ribonucleoprotein 70 kDa, partial [Reticulomyxa filosa]
DKDKDLKPEKKEDKDRDRDRDRREKTPEHKGEKDKKAGNGHETEDENDDESPIEGTEMLDDMILTGAMAANDDDDNGHEKESKTEDVVVHLKDLSVLPMSFYNTKSKTQSLRMNRFLSSIQHSDKLSPMPPHPYEEETPMSDCESSADNDSHDLDHVEHSTVTLMDDRFKKKKTRLCIR